MTTPPSRLFVPTLYAIALVQFVLGLGFLLAPDHVVSLLTLAPAAPRWVRWLLAMMAARFLGFGWGMWWAARHPTTAGAWLDAMIAVQVIDWVATIVALGRGDVGLAQVTTAPFLPVLFLAVLLRERMRSAAR